MTETTVANGRTKTEVLLRAALDSGVDFTALSDEQAGALSNLLGILPSLFEHARGHGDIPLGLIPYHARMFALATVQDPSVPAED